jgi:hypothetical protein
MKTTLVEFLIPIKMVEVMRYNTSYYGQCHTLKYIIYLREGTISVPNDYKVFKTTWEASPKRMLEEEQKMEEEKEMCKVLDGQYVVHACKDSFVKRSPTMVVYDDETIHLDASFTSNDIDISGRIKTGFWSNTKEIYGSH